MPRQFPPPEPLAADGSQMPAIALPKVPAAPPREIQSDSVTIKGRSLPKASSAAIVAVIRVFVSDKDAARCSDGHSMEARQRPSVSRLLIGKRGVGCAGLE